MHYWPNWIREDSSIFSSNAWHAISVVNFYQGFESKPAGAAELLSNLVFEGCWSCGDLVGVCGFDSVFERDACDDFREVVKAA